MNLVDPSGLAVPPDVGDESTIFGNGGGSNGAHPGPNVWGAGQLNGYASLQTAALDNAPGLECVYGDLQGPRGWAYWGPLLGTIGIGGVIIAAPEIIAAAPEAIGAGVETAQARAVLLRSQVRVFIQLVRDLASTDAIIRIDAREELARRLQIANAAAERTLSSPAKRPATIVARAAAAWIYTFIAG